VSSLPLAQRLMARATPLCLQLDRSVSCLPAAAEGIGGRMSGPSDREVLTRANHRNVGETATLLARALGAQNITGFAQIDQ
jgi:hypothetical protein